MAMTYKQFFKFCERGVTGFDHAADMAVLISSMGPNSPLTTDEKDYVHNVSLKLLKEILYKGIDRENTQLINNPKK